MKASTEHGNKSVQGRPASKRRRISLELCSIKGASSSINWSPGIDGASKQ